MVKNIIVLGPPGAGKGTLCEKLNEIGITHISTGNIFRKEIQSQSELGKQVQQIVISGGYVTDEITNQILLKAISPIIASNKSFILDGFPRTIAQAQFLEKNNINIELAILLEASEETIIKRLSGRRNCPICRRIYHIDFNPPKISNKCDQDGGDLYIRADDEPTKIARRLEMYQNETKILIDYYAQKQLIKIFKSDTTIDDIFEQIKSDILKNDTIKV